MPCYDERNSASWQDEHVIKPMQKRLDLTTRLACDYCKSLERRGLPIPAFAREWWKNHKKADAKRLKRKTS